MFAALPDPNGPESIGWIVMALGGLALLLNQGWSFISQLRGKPENSELKGSADVIAKRVEALEAGQKHGADRRQQIWAEFGAVRGEVKDEISAVYGEVNKLRETTAGLKATVDLLNQTVAQLNYQLAHQRQPLAK